MNRLKNLKRENKQNHHDVLKQNKSSFEKLLNLKKRIQDNLDALTCSYNKIVQESFKDEFNSSVNEIEEQLNIWERDSDYVKISQYIKEEPYGKLRKKERMKFDKLKTFLHQNGYFGEVCSFLLNIDKNIKSCLDSFKKNKLDNFKIIDYNKGNKFGQFDRKYKTQENFLNQRSSVFNSYIVVKEKKKDVVPEKNVGIIEYFTGTHNAVKYFDIDQFTSEKKEQEVKTPLEPTLEQLSKEKAFDINDNFRISGVSQSFRFKKEEIKEIRNSIDIKGTDDKESKVFDDKFENQLNENISNLKNSLLKVIEELVKKINNGFYFNKFNSDEIKVDAIQSTNDIKEIFKDIFEFWKK